MKKIFILSLMLLIFNITGVYATALSIPDLPIPDLKDIGNTIDNSIIPIILPDNNIDSDCGEETDCISDPTNILLDTPSNALGVIDDTGLFENTSSTTNNFLIWGGIIVVLAGGLYLYLSKRDRY